ncbi:MAG: hypothetical protein ACRD0X_02470 [Thermoanaerobaculia bacterium]
MSEAENRDLLALFPAAGRASRLPGSTGSKEVRSIHAETRTGAPRLACQDLLEAFADAAPTALLVLTRRRKLDVPLRLAELALPYPVVTLLVGDTPSVVHTLDAAWPFTRGRRIALGFPDVLLEPQRVFIELLERQARTGAAVVLGLFPAAEPERSDLVDLGPDGRVRRLAVKERIADLSFTWMTAVWTGEFTEYLHGSLRGPLSAFGDDLQVGHLLQSALRSGMCVEGVAFPGGRVLDIGTPAALAAAPGWLAARRSD